MNPPTTLSGCVLLVDVQCSFCWPDFEISTVIKHISYVTHPMTLIVRDSEGHRCFDQQMPSPDLHSHARVFDKGNESLTPVTAWRVFWRRIKASLVLIRGCLRDNDTLYMLADHAADFELKEHRCRLSTC